MTPSPFAQIVTVASYEIRKYIRGRRLLGMLILLALIVGLFVGLPPALGIKYASTPDAFVSTFATFSGLLVVLGGVLFAADALVSEHEKRTGYFLARSSPACSSAPRSCRYTTAPRRSPPSPSPSP